MQYSINLYMKNMKKSEKLKKIIEELGEIQEKTHKAEMDIDILRKKLFKNFAGKTIKTGVEYNGRMIVVGKLGIGRIGSYSRKAEFGDVDESLLDYLRTRRQDFNKIKAKIRKPDKKEIFAFYVRNASDKENRDKTFKIKVGRSIIDPDSMKPAHISIIKATVDDGDFSDVDLQAESTNKDYFALNEDDNMSENMIKEQLYLPIWKLLVKVKRHALKQKRIAENILGRAKKELEPYWVAERLAEATE